MRNSIGYHRPSSLAAACTCAKTAQAAARGFCERRDIRLTSFFIDGPETCDKAWFERPQGARLATVLRRGDEVIVVGGGGIFTTHKNLASSVRNLWEKGVALHVIGLDGKSIFSTAENGALVVQALQHAAEVEASSRSEAIHVGILERKLQRRRHARCAGYGHKWQRGKRLVDSHEQLIISKIRRWREEGRSWNEIATHLLYLGETTAAGIEWSPARVRRAWFAFQRRSR
jgi:DNA invertase Pin-like site-specific DNA recombinase